MNAYDFDGTIYDGDSTRDFIAYCAIRHLGVLFRVPGAILALFAHFLGILSRDEVKERCLHVLTAVPNLDEAVFAFWDRNISKIMRWYIDQSRPDDLVISASPSVLVAEACRRIGVTQLIATEVDVLTMRLLTPNCRGYEKVRRIKLEWPDTHVDAFYSDSLSDEPMARIAKEAYLVHRGKVLPWG